MNYFKISESLLSAVPSLRIAKENLLTRKQAFEKEQGMQIDKIKSYNNTGEVTKKLEQLIEPVETNKELLLTEKKLAEIEKVLMQLPNEERKILRLWYIEKKPKEKILGDLHIESLSTLYNLRNKSVADFALLYYGASALGSI